ncbi:MAG: putative peptidoglycan glycosyltransferase FtsW [Candidatus Atribacteria bacterium]|nr:putative peptidoglycan glycosyltransferase FtsW [Candidatus Atribacteria bacterium]
MHRWISNHFYDFKKRRWWWDVDPYLFWSVILLLSLGLVMVLSASMTTALMSFSDGSFNFQPSELAKLSLILYMSNTLVTHPHRAQDFVYGVIPFLLVLGLMGVLVLMEPDMGTALFLGIMTFVMLFLGGRRVSHLLLPAIAAIPVLIFLIYSGHNAYWQDRIESFIDPWKEPLGKGFQIIQSLIAIGTGGILGRGLGESRQKFFYLPDRHTDFIFAIIGEELGIVGTIGVVILFGIILWRGWTIACRCGDEFQSIFALGLTLNIVLQALINMCAVLRIVPVTGITLPFVSYGNSSVLISLVEVGLLFNIAQHQKVTQNG